MDSILTGANITWLIWLIGIVFAIYLYFRKPQEKLEMGQVIAEKEIANKATILAQKEMESKANLLAEQVGWEKSANEKKFIEYGRKLDEVMVHSQKESLKIELKLDAFIHSQMLRNEEYGNHFTKLFTLLEERLPKKQ
jgi:hypothetical protein